MKSKLDRETILKALALLDESIRDFVDRFNETPRSYLPKNEPRLLAGCLNDGGIANAWLAVTAVCLANKHDQRPPTWIHDNARALSKSCFAAKTPNLKAVLLQENPAPSRVRNIFVSVDALACA